MRKKQQENNNMNDDVLREIFSYLTFPNNTTTVCKSWRAVSLEAQFDENWKRASINLYNAITRYNNDRIYLAPSQSKELVQLNKDSPDHGTYCTYFIKTVQELKRIEKDIHRRNKELNYIGHFATFYHEKKILILLIRFLSFGLGLCALILSAMVMFGSRKFYRPATLVCVLPVYLIFILNFTTTLFVLCKSWMEFEKFYWKECVWSLFQNGMVLLFLVMCTVNLAEVFISERLDRVSSSLYEFDKWIPSFVVFTPLFIIHLVTLVIWIIHNGPTMAKSTALFIKLFVKNQLTNTQLAEYVAYCVGRVISLYQIVAFVAAEILFCLHIRYNLFILFVGFIPLLLYYVVELVELFFTSTVLRKFHKEGTEKPKLTRFKFTISSAVRALFSLTLFVSMAIQSIQIIAVAFVVPYLIYHFQLLVCPLMFYVEFPLLIEGTWYTQRKPESMKDKPDDEVNHVALIYNLLKHSRVHTGE